MTEAKDADLARKIDLLMSHREIKDMLYRVGYAIEDGDFQRIGDIMGDATLGADMIGRRVFHGGDEIRDQYKDQNRFTGKSFYPEITSSGGLYCSTQQSALVNELLHYGRPEIPGGAVTGAQRIDRSLASKCIVKIRLMGCMLAADLSPHNPGAQKFVEDLGKAPSVQAAFHSTGGLATVIWQELFDKEDCSVARGIGLAVANSGPFRALQALSVRPSGRPGGETGDNIVFFGHDRVPPEGLYIEEAYLFPLNSKPQKFSVEFVS